MRLHLASLAGVASLPAALASSLASQPARGSPASARLACQWGREPVLAGADVRQPPAPRAAPEWAPQPTRHWRTFSLPEASSQKLKRCQVEIKQLEAIDWLHCCCALVQVLVAAARRLVGSPSGGPAAGAPVGVGQRGALAVRPARTRATWRRAATLLRLGAASGRGRVGVRASDGQSCHEFAPAAARAREMCARLAARQRLEARRQQRRPASERASPL